MRIKELCEQYGILDQAPRLIISGDKRTLNTRVVELLANQAYYKAEWAIEDTEQELGPIYRVMGRKGLESIESAGSRLTVCVGTNRWHFCGSVVGSDPQDGQK